MLWMDIRRCSVSSCMADDKRKTTLLKVYFRWWQGWEMRMLLYTNYLPTMDWDNETAKESVDVVNWRPECRFWDSGEFDILVYWKSLSQNYHHNLSPPSTALAVYCNPPMNKIKESADVDILYRISLRVSLFHRSAIFLWISFCKTINDAQWTQRQWRAQKVVNQFVVIKCQWNAKSCMQHREPM